MADDKPIPLTRALGRFVGHIWHATTKPAPRSERETVHTEHETKHGEIDGQRVVLRRTTIDEIEYLEAPKDTGEKPQ